MSAPGEGGQGPASAVDPSQIAARLARVRSQIDAACRAAGRAPETVELVAVSKRHPDAAVHAAAAAGQRVFGENLVQAWRARLGDPGLAALRWHLIGPIQTNKARYLAASRPALVHTLDRPALLEALDRRLQRQREREPEREPLDVLLQVNIDAEPQKAGCAPEDVDALADLVASTSTLRLRGLMCIPRPVPGGAPRAAFARLRALGEAVRDRVDLAAGPLVLSMGMSSDYEAAIAEGATLVRVGTAIFGPRPG